MCVWPGRRARNSRPPPEIFLGARLPNGNGLTSGPPRPSPPPRDLRSRPLVGPRKFRGRRPEAYTQRLSRYAAHGQSERVNGGGVEVREVPALGLVSELGIETDADREALEVEGEPLERH